MIFNNSETSGPLRILKMYSFGVYIKSFGGQKGGSSELPRTPLPTGLYVDSWHVFMADLLLSPKLYFMMENLIKVTAGKISS